MELTEYELLQIIKLFNCIQLILIFTSLIRFLKRFKRVNTDQMSFAIETLVGLRRRLQKGVHTTSALKVAGERIRHQYTFM